MKPGVVDTVALYTCRAVHCSHNLVAQIISSSHAISWILIVAIMLFHFGDDQPG